jgi:hypothetical protein
MVGRRQNELDPKKTEIERAIANQTCEDMHTSSSVMARATPSGPMIGVEKAAVGAGKGARVNS